MRASATSCNAVIRIGHCVQVVVFAAFALHIVRVGPNHLAALTLRELSHVDPDLLIVSLAELTVVHVCLVIDSTCSPVLFLISLSLGTNSHLSPETVITP